MKMNKKHRRTLLIFPVFLLILSLAGCGLPDGWEDPDPYYAGSESFAARPSHIPSDSSGSQALTEDDKDEAEQSSASVSDIYNVVSDPGQLTELPSRYDYRENGRCPKVESQGNLSTCWAFATTLALESSLLPEESWYFSEDHLSLSNSFGFEQDAGGDYTMAMSYLLAWQGPVTEEDDPYGDGISPEGLSAVKHVQEIQILPEDDLDAIKLAVYLYGGVQTSLFMEMDHVTAGSEYYDSHTYSYYYTGDDEPNHDVVVIGWDDDYPAENFVHDPGTNGAFICVNSWGENFGENGIFYVSYADAHIGSYNIVYTAIEDPDNYDRLYQSDLCGWLGQLGYGENEAYFANVYTAEADGTIEAVGFYATGADTEYEVYEVKSAPDNGQLVLGDELISGYLENSGYYTVRLPESVKISRGERFAMAVRVRTPGSTFPVAVEFFDSGGEFTANVDLSDGEGYISADGINWVCSEKTQSSNVCLKIYAGE